MFNEVFLIALFACWGSFLNVLGYRLIHNVSLLKVRSFCPTCNHLIYWYDNIPIISWMILQRRCRHCHFKISILYPLIELFSIVFFSLLYTHVNTHYFLGYFIFFSALITIIRSDLETMLISQYTTLFLIPIAFFLSYFHYLTITLFESVLGAFIGYASLWLVAHTFKFFTGKEGLGQGDIDLLSMIGSFTGVIGVWTSVLIGSVSGSLIGITYLFIYHKKSNIHIPFGPFLSLGALFFVLWQKIFITLLLPY